MAEKSSRPGAEEDAEEEGEEAAEAPAVKAVIEEESTDEEECEEAAVPDSPPPPPEEAEEPPPPGEAEEPVLPTSPPDSPPEPSYPAPAEAPAYTPVSPVYPTVCPAFYPPPVCGMNLFANDGSFLEVFKKRMEATGTVSKEESEVPEKTTPEPDKRRPVSFVGKRRGGAKLALKTGIVAKKPKTEEEEILTDKGGAWAQYMAEVKKYKAHQCSDDDKTRPLVK